MFVFLFHEDVGHVCLLRLRLICAHHAANANQARTIAQCGHAFVHCVAVNAPPSFTGVWPQSSGSLHFSGLQSLQAILRSMNIPSEYAGKIASASSNVKISVLHMRAKDVMIISKEEHALKQSIRYKLMP